jgi:molecular chaperone IbpA|tara:strand:+ start:242 stop:685 length:444 start_codon:yes stop_codon:yes gene_type:complete
MVTKQQFRVTTDTLTPLYKASVGFDQMVNEFFNAGTLDNTSGYPPYNISKDSNDVYEITLAVAGFKKSDIEIELEDGTLKIVGNSAVLDSTEKEYLHKGIAERNFIRTFKLAEYVEVKDAKLEDGILRVSLFRNVPEALKPQKISIG